MGVYNRDNPLVLLGVGLLFGTGLSGLLAGVPVEVAAVQLSLPIVVSLGLFSYAWSSRGQHVPELWSTVFLWTGYGILAFVIVGFWFGQVSRLFDTSFLLAITASLATGTAFGATVGVYSARLQHANDELETRNNQLDQFISVVSHDLRNPLTVATGRLELAQSECDSDHLPPIERSLERMDVLIDDLLVLARAGDRVGAVEPIELDACSHQCWKTVATADATLVVDTERQFQADRTRLEQLLENLFRNAVEHGGRAVTITVGDLDDGFYVADDGSGIPDADHETVFESGYTTSDTGTGLGLMIVTEIARGHGWEVSITDSVDGGARFEFTGVTSAP